MIGEAVDLEDGTLNNVRWFLSGIGQIGEGPVFTFLSSSSSYSVGNKVVTAIAVDNNRGTGIDISSITIGLFPPSPFMEIEDNSPTPIFTTSGSSGNDKHLEIDLRIVLEGTSTGIEGVTVKLDLFKNGGLIEQLTAATISNGNVHFQQNNIPDGLYNIDIMSIEKAGVIWDLVIEPFESETFLQDTS